MAARDYGANVGLTFLGVASAFVIVYMLSNNLAQHLPRFASLTLAWIGRSTMYILIINTLLGGYISEKILALTGFGPSNVINAAISIPLQLAAGAGVTGVICICRRLISRARAAHDGRRQCI